MSVNLSNLIGNNPEADFGGNRRDDFGGVITSVLLMPWRFPGAKPRVDQKTGRTSPFPPYNLFARIGIKADEDSPYSGSEDYEMFQAGYLGSAAPTDDGENPKDLTWDVYKTLEDGEAEIGEGEEEDLGAVYVMGRRKNFKLPSSDYAQFLVSIDRLIKDATPEEVAAHGFKGWSPDHSCIVGLHLHFNLLNRDEKAGNRRPTVSKDPNAPKKEFPILCATALLDPLGNPVSSSDAADLPTTSKTTKPKSSSAASKANGADTSDLESRVSDWLVTQIVTNLGNSKKTVHGEIMPLIVSAFPAEIADAVSLMNGPWSSNADRPWTRKGTAYELKG